MLDLIPSIGVSMCLYILMPRHLLYMERVQVVQMRVVSHRLQRGIESYMVSPMQRPYLLTVKLEHMLTKTDANVCPMHSFSVIFIHLDKNGCCVVDLLEGIGVFIQIDTDYIAIPTDSPEPVPIVKGELSLAWTGQERLIATVFLVPSPCDA